VTPPARLVERATSVRTRNSIAYFFGVHLTCDVNLEGFLDLTKFELQAEY